MNTTITIFVSCDEPAAAFAAVEAMADREVIENVNLNGADLRVRRGDFTCITGADEITGAILLASVHHALCASDFASAALARISEGKPAGFAEAAAAYAIEAWNDAAMAGADAYAAQLEALERFADAEIDEDLEREEITYTVPGRGGVVANNGRLTASL